MDHPLPIAHRKGMVLGYLQIIHHHRPRYHLPPCDNSNPVIRPQETHAQLDLPDWQEPLLQRQERMLLVGMHHLTRLRCRLAMLSLHCRGNRQVNQVVIVVDPHMHDGLQLYLVRLGVVGQHSLTDLQRADGLLVVIGRDTGGFGEVIYLYRLIGLALPTLSKIDVIEADVTDLLDGNMGKRAEL